MKFKVSNSIKKIALFEYKSKLNSESIWKNCKKFIFHVVSFIHAAFHKLEDIG